jgi:hypothetical protein
MENDQFVARINRILMERRLSLPLVEGDETGDITAVSAWAGFLQDCVRAGIQISDPRWQRLRVARNTPVTQLVLDEDFESPSDEEFKVGLALLMSLFSDKPPR